jgi:GT2 family glycosyltransferase
MTSQSTTPSASWVNPPGPLPLVSVVLLSYARPQFLGEALESVVRQSYPNLEILVVDNPSEASEEIAVLVGRHPQVRLIQNTQNVGFATGMNIGARQASGAYIYLTEDDMVLEVDCIRELVEYALAEPNVGLVSGLVLNKSEGTIRCAGADMTLGTLFRMDVIGLGQRDQGQFPTPFDVAYIPGAMVFASGELWKALGGFRDDFFMYFEDVELCLRARRHGYRITIVPAAKALHFEPPAAPSSDVVTFHKIKNSFSVYVLHAPLSMLVIVMLRQTLIELPRSIFTDRRQSALIWRALRASWAGRADLWRQRRTCKAQEVQRTKAPSGVRA